MPMATNPPDTASEPGEHVDAVVVGAGLAGLYMLYRLRQLGLAVRAIEAGDDVGGTWYWNRYPGARCDVESMHYSYSFSPELEQEWNWSERYPAQPELLRYIRHVADRFDLRRHVRFGTRVVAVHHDERTRVWRVRTDQGRPVTARFCVLATGCLSVAKTPEIPGIDSFAGPVYHTARWPHDGVDFTGLRVGLVGTGSSGVQSIPVIARQAAELTVFQRTPAYSMPAWNRPLTDAERDRLKAGYRVFRQQQRESGFGVPSPHPPATRSALQVGAEERNRTYQQRWEFGSVTALMSAFTDLAVDEHANDTAAEFVRSKIRQIVRDPVVAEDLCPRYPFGTKRPCLDTDYYATYNRDNVRLVNLRRTPLVAVTARGVRTSSQEYGCDAIVLATGFDAMTGALTAIDIRGRSGRSLREKWAAGPRAYLGLATWGFPNLFMITGPGSPSALSNMIVSIEQHVEWIADCIRWLRERGLSTIEATRSAEDDWVAHVAAVASGTLYPRTDSWYLGANVPGKARVFMPYAGGVGAYRRICDGVAADGYRGFTLTP
ncbi:cyclohexanone monooxygenase [Plantactinospora sp. BC1]|nr:cyclohexanone monooxygenase [Plantactinospora sp. BC1]